MMRIAAFALIFAVTSTSPAAPVPKSPEQEKTLVGTWYVESLVMRGSSPIDLDAFKEPRYWTIDSDGNRTIHATANVPAKEAKSNRLTIDPKTHGLDVDFRNGMSWPGVYELDGDILKICYSPTKSGVRPKKAEAGPDVYLWTFKRVKEEKK